DAVASQALRLVSLEIETDGRHAARTPSFSGLPDSMAAAGSAIVGIAAPHASRTARPPLDRVERALRQLLEAAVEAPAMAARHRPAALPALRDATGGLVVGHAVHEVQ